MACAVVMTTSLSCADHYSHPHHHHHHHPSHHHAHPQHHPHHISPSHNHRNQRIIKVHHQPHYYKQHKPWGPPPSPHHHHHHEADHYEYIRPRTPPPTPPSHKPSFYSPPSGNNIKHLPRPPPQYKSSTFGNYPLKTSSGSFRPPVIKEHFRTPTLTTLSPSSSLEYIPSKPLPSPLTHFHTDDNRGPIHEIPAPNLGPKSHIDLGSSSESLNNFEKHKEHYETSFSKPDTLDFDKHIEPFKNSFTSDFEKNIDPFKSSFTSGESHKFGKELDTSEHGPSYEVTESSHASNDHVLEGLDGTKSYYAPDPDPSLPVHKVPPTTDPFSTPSSGSPEYLSHHMEFQILDGGSLPTPVNTLSGQELFNLMHGLSTNQQHFPQHALMQQPPLVTLLAQPTMLVTPQPDHQVHSFNHPQFQSFNYIENNPFSGAVPMEDYRSQHLSYDHEASESENKFRGSAEEDDRGVEDVSNNLVDNPVEDFEMTKHQDKSPIFEMKGEPVVPFYSSLPNRHAAEALAALQAAGSIASNYVTKLNGLRGDQKVEVNEDYAEEDESTRPLGLTEEQLTKPHKVAYVPQIQTLHSIQPTLHQQQENVLQQFTTPKPENTEVEVQKSIPLYEASYVSRGLVDPETDREFKMEKKELKSVPVQQFAEEKVKPDIAILANLDFGQGAASEKFGKRIRPK